MRKAIEEGFRLRPNADLRDVCHQRHHTAATRVSRPRLHAALVRNRPLTLRPARAARALGTTPIGHFRACRALAGMYNDSDPDSTAMAAYSHPRMSLEAAAKGP